MYPVIRRIPQRPIERRGLEEGGKAKQRQLERGGAFVLEMPRKHVAWKLPTVRKLLKASSVRKVDLDFI